MRAFWDEAACGERMLLPSADRAGFTSQAAERYRLEPYILDFARFESWSGKRVLEIGVGLGADHQRFVEAERGKYWHRPDPARHRDDAQSA